MGKQIADMLRPSMKDQIPTDADEIAKSFGRGWWKPNPQAAAELLERAGYSKKGDKWFTPDGKPFAITLMVEGDSRPVMTRAGSMIAQQWSKFGIDASTVVAQGSMADRRAAGDFEAMITWSVETWGGHPDLSFFLDSWHSQFVAAPGKPQPPRNWQRWSNPELDKIIEQIRQIGFDDPKGLELGRDYVKLAVREMPTIPADVVQCLHRHGRHLLDRIPERRERALHRSGAELGQHQVHDGETEAPAVSANKRTKITCLPRHTGEVPRLTGRRGKAPQTISKNFRSEIAGDLACCLPPSGPVGHLPRKTGEE